MRHVLGVAVPLLLLASAPALAQVPANALAFGIIPDDGLDDTNAIRAALVNNRSIYFPPGVYHLSGMINLASNTSLVGAGMDETIFRLTADVNPFRATSTSNVCLQDFEVHRPMDNSREEMIFALSGASNVRVVRVRSRDNTSRAPSIRFISTTNCTVAGCETLNDQRNIFEDGHDQVYGSGITFEGCTDSFILGNRVVQEIPLANPSNPYFNYYQSGAIQASGCTRVTIIGNYVYYSGNGIDVGGTDTALLEGNVVVNVHQAGIKLVNGSRNQVLRSNWVTQAGLMSIWLSPGTQNLPITNCLVDQNTITRVGEGIGKDWWDGSFNDTGPAGIHIDVASSSSGRSHDNTISNNVIHNGPDRRRTVIVRPGTHAAYNITLTNNQLVGTTNTIPPDPPEPLPADYELCVDPRRASLMFIGRP